MAEMLNSIIIKKPDDDIFKQILTYCEEHGLKTTVFKNLPQSKFEDNTILVWGTRKQLSEFSTYF